VSRIRLQDVVLDKSQIFEVTKTYIQTKHKIYQRYISKLKGSQWSRLRIDSARAIILLWHNTISLSHSLSQSNYDCSTNSLLSFVTISLTPSLWHLIILTSCINIQIMNVYECRLRAMPLFSFVLLFPGLRLNERENGKKGRRRKEK
jgi:hypothetical protein